MVLVKVKTFGTDTRYGPGILHKRGKKIKTKSQKVLGNYSYACRSCVEKTGKGEAFCPPS